MHDLPGLLNHWSLVLAHRNRSCLEGSDVGCLADGIGEKSHRDAGLKITHLDLRLNRGIALKAGYGHQIHVIEGHLTQFRYLGLDKQHGLGRVQPACQIIQGHFYDVLTHLFRVVRIICQSLRIGYHNINLIKLSRVLKLHPALQ